MKRTLRLFEPATIVVVTPGYTPESKEYRADPKINDRLASSFYDHMGFERISFDMAVSLFRPDADFTARKLFRRNGLILHSLALGFPVHSPGAQQLLETILHYEHSAPPSVFREQEPYAFKDLKCLALTALHLACIEYQAVNPYAKYVLVVMENELATALLLCMDAADMWLDPLQGFVLRPRPRPNHRTYFVNSLVLPGSAH